MASGGYPGAYEKGKKIQGLADADSLKDVVVFHAGTTRTQDDAGSNVYRTNGGRVLNVTALGKDIQEAIDTCYKAVRKVKFEKAHFRSDIGQRALRRLTHGATAIKRR
jgi:phosphoribosylamine--glycine ligase